MSEPSLNQKSSKAAGGPVMIEEKILHTGQHYSIELSEQIFKQLNIPQPYLNLGIGSMNHGQMTGEMIIRIEKEIQHENPDWVIVFGDTNSTLAGALAAAKLHVPVCHVEAGLRSFDKRMPEEVNRVLTDHVSTLLFAPTHTAVKNLKQENISKGVHRQENTDVRENMKGIFQAFDEIASADCPVILPIHPRTSKMLERYKIHPRNPAVRIIPPVSFLDMIILEKDAWAILTDSGGIQKEAYFHRTPCITLRDVTEWVETVEAGWNQLVGARTEKIIRAVGQIKKGSIIDDYGKGDSGQEMIKLLMKNK